MDGPPPELPSRRRAVKRWLAGMAPARVLLALSVIGAAYLLVGFVLLAPWVCAFALAFWVWRRRRQEPDITHGSARWADARNDLLPVAGMLGGDTGLVVGQIYAPRPTVKEAVSALFDRKLGSCEACCLFARLVQPRQPPVDVRVPQAQHWAIVGPPGSGKSSGVAIPMLLDCRDSMIVADMKGELFLATAAHRREAFGHKVVRLDPFGVCPGESDTLNVLDLIDLDSPVALDQVRALAEALVIRTGHEKEPHWNSSAETYITCMIAATLMFAQPDLRSLQAVREMLVNAEMRAETVRYMLASDAFDGLLQRLAHGLSQFVGNEQSSVLTTTSQHLKFLDTPGVMKSTSSTSFDPRELLTGKMTIYLILPPVFVRSHAGLLRLWLVALIQAVVRGGLQERKLVHVLVDEAAVLQKILIIDDCLNRFRGYGLRLVLMYQSLSQIQECWPEGKEHSVLATTSQLFIGIADYQTAEQVSSRIGDATVFAHSRGGNRGWSVQRSAHEPSGSHGRSGGSSDNRSPAQRRLITPAEVLQLPVRVALVLVPGLPAINTALRRYYDPPPHPSGRWSGFVIRLGALALFVLVTVCGVRLTEALTAPRPRPPQRAVNTGVRHEKPASKVLPGDRGRVEKTRDTRQR